MTKKDKNIEGLEALNEIDKRLGNLFGQVLDAFKEAGDRVVNEEFDKSIDTPDGKSVGRVSGHVRVGPASASRQAAAKPSKPTGPVNAEAAAPQPLSLELIDRGESALIVFDAMGAQKDAIEVTLSDAAISVRIEGPSVYEASLSLPKAVAASTQELSVVNGIATLSFRYSDHQ